MRAITPRGTTALLQVEKRAAASTVNLALASLDTLHRCLGLGRPHVRRDKPVQAAPRALTGLCAQASHAEHVWPGS